MRALISVTDKTGIVELGQALTDLGVEIISTGGTAKVLQDAGVEVVPIEQFTGFPEMLDGRVKTLHPKIHGGLLALRSDADHMATVKAHDIELIDIVVVNLYAFEKTISNPGVTLAHAIENIDIGGPSMLRSAAKNFGSVAVVVSPKHYQLVVDELRQFGSVSDQTRFRLAAEAFDHTAKYDAMIAAYLLEKSAGAETSRWPERLVRSYDRVTELRYGENPHQSAALYSANPKRGLLAAVQHHGKEMSYNNYIDTEAAWQISKAFTEPAVAIIKHTNPCGFAIGDSIEDAYDKAFNADPVSAFGSIVGINRKVTLALANKLGDLFVEVVIAPEYDAEALAYLSQKPSIRILQLPDYSEPDDGVVMRPIQGGLLVQEADTWNVTESDLSVQTQRTPTGIEKADLLVAFKLVKFVKSNAIVLVKNGVGIGVGAGQMSRVESVRIALGKAGDHAKGAVVGSDAFFPFRDSIDILAPHGITAVVQPGGSKRDSEVIQACNENGIAMVFTNHRHFKH